MSEVMINKQVFLTALDDELGKIEVERMEIGDIANAVGVSINKLLPEDVDMSDVINNAEAGIKHGLSLKRG